MIWGGCAGGWGKGCGGALAREGTPRETSGVRSRGTKTHFPSKILLRFMSCLLGYHAVYVGTRRGSALLLHTRHSIGNTLRVDRSSGRCFSSTIRVTPANFSSTILIYCEKGASWFWPLTGRWLKLQQSRAVKAFCLLLGPVGSNHGNLKQRRSTPALPHLLFTTHHLPTCYYRENEFLIGN